MSDLVVEYGEDGGGRIACLKLSGEWVREEIIFCTLLVGFQGIVKKELKVVGRNSSVWRDMTRLRGGHKC